MRNALSPSDVLRLSGREPGLPSDPSDRDPGESGEDLGSEDRRVGLLVRMCLFPFGSFTSLPRLGRPELDPGFRGSCRVGLALSPHRGETCSADLLDLSDPL
jgi:hypothetical protein